MTIKKEVQMKNIRMHLHSAIECVATDDPETLSFNNLRAAANQAQQAAAALHELIGQIKAEQDLKN